MANPAGHEQNQRRTSPSLPTPPKAMGALAMRMDGFTAAFQGKKGLNIEITGQEFWDCVLTNIQVIQPNATIGIPEPGHPKRSKPSLWTGLQMQSLFHVFFPHSVWARHCRGYWWFAYPRHCSAGAHTEQSPCVRAETLAIRASPCFLGVGLGGRNNNLTSF